jgi:hypothetical protein
MVRSRRAMTTPPKSRRSASAPTPKSRRKVYFGAAALVLLLAGLVIAYQLSWGDRARHHDFPVRWPVSAPTGDPVSVAYDVKPGDVFVTTVESFGQFVLSVEEHVSTKSGMYLRVAFTLGHRVEEKPGGGLRSTVKALLDRASSDIPDVRETIQLLLGDRTTPYTVTFDRGADGRPDRATTGGDVKKPPLRTMFDRALGGLGDLVTNYLPPRDVRVGETWDLASVADLPGAQEVVHFAARSGATEGYPAPRIRGVVAAEGLEDREGEPTLRLRVIWYLDQEGDAVAPAKPGWLTTAALLDGTVWVSRKTGIVWEADVASRMISSYLVPNYPTERKGEGRITWKTRRAEKMPE